MPRKPKSNMRQLSAFVNVFVGIAVLVVGWAVWRLIASNGATRAGPWNSTPAAFSTLPASQAAPAGEQSNSAFAGGPAPDFSLTIFDTGKTVMLSGLRGEPVILDFFASWCPSCQAEAPRLQEFWQRYGNRGLRLLGIALNDSADGLRAFKQDFLLTYPIGLDKTGEIAANYRVGGIPTFVFVDQQGQIAKIVVGQMDENALVAEAEALLK